MNGKIEKLILRIYQLLPTVIQEKQCIMNIVMPIVQKQLRSVKQDILKANWEKVRLENQVKQLKNKEL